VNALCDASVLIALIDRGDPDHERCVAGADGLTGPLTTTWLCFTEAMHLLYRYGGWTAQEKLWDAIDRAAVVLYQAGIVRGYSARAVRAASASGSMDPLRESSGSMPRDERHGAAAGVSS